VVSLSLAPILALFTSMTLATPARSPALGKRKAGPPPRVVELYQVNTREVLQLRYPAKGLQRKADQFFRCHHTNTRGRMNPRLVRLLFDTGRHFPGRRIEVVSGYRHPTVAKNPHSPHMKGLACDFRVSGIDNIKLRDYLRRAFPKVGVGYYPNSSFVHLDVRRDGSAFWIDYSAPGENALYSDNPSEDLKSGRAETFRPAHIDPAWAESDDQSPEAAAGAGGQGPDPRQAAAFPSVR
jgi:uncharacterized protein YcbK (DUF882 family)